MMAPNWAAGLLPLGEFIRTFKRGPITNLRLLFSPYRFRAKARTLTELMATTQDRASKKKKERAREESAGFFKTVSISLDPAASNAGLPPKLALISISLLLFLLFVPFVASAFRIDDPLFLWAARQIQESPANPYAFKVNGY